MEEKDKYVWDESSQLYFHPRSGFYHDPNAGWYYSTRDGLYYKFENGNYILLDLFNKDQQPDVGDQGDLSSYEPQQQVLCDQSHDQNEQENQGSIECPSSQLSENPPSEWLEDTLIELYLSGYSNKTSNAADDLMLPEETDERDGSILTSDGNYKFNGDEDAEFSLDNHAKTDSSVDVSYQEVSWEEENWQAQYGQVVQQDDERREFHCTDMWDWSMVSDIPKEGSCSVARIVGKLVQPSAKLHPSMPSQGRRLRTAPICKVHLDMVQVTSGQVYKLRTPSARYLASLSSYDATNPTKDWGFPELSIEGLIEANKSKIPLQKTSSYHDKPSVNRKDKANGYRDRAAERRSLHGNFSVAPGQKRSADDRSPPSSPIWVPSEVAADEALKMSLGAGSYAQKILKNMGWKEGEGLGKTQQGLKEPLQGIGNKGTAGLGWRSK